LTFEAESLIRIPTLGDAETWDILRGTQDLQWRLGLFPLVTELSGWSLRGYGLFVVLREGDGAVVGVAGLAPPFRNSGPHLLCGILPKCRGSGRATRACLSVLNWAQAHSFSVYAHVDLDNPDGDRLTMRLGGERVEPTAPDTSPEAKRDYRFPC